MRLTDLDASQKTQLRQALLTARTAKEEGRTPSYGELAEADSLVTDGELEAEYAETEFTEDDFV